MKWSPDAIEGEVLEKIRTRLSHPYGDDTVKLKITIGFGTPELFREAEEWNNRLVFLWDVASYLADETVG